MSDLDLALKAAQSHHADACVGLRWNVAEERWEAFAVWRGGHRITLTAPTADNAARRLLKALTERKS